MEKVGVAVACSEDLVETDNLGRPSEFLALP